MIVGRCSQWHIRNDGLMPRSRSLLLLLVLAVSVTGSSVIALQKPDIKSNLPENRKVELGRTLFFDKRLSEDGTVSCAACHDPASAFTSAGGVAIGVRERRGTRNAPTL